MTLTALPVEAGEQKLQIEGEGPADLADEQSMTIRSRALAAILFEVVDVEIRSKSAARRPTRSA